MWRIDAGGIRCERASALVRSLGHDRVYQLKGGIHKYLEAFPEGSDSQWSGKNYTFDKRWSAYLIYLRHSQSRSNTFLNLQPLILLDSRMALLRTPLCKGRKVVRMMRTRRGQARRWRLPRHQETLGLDQIQSLQV